MSSSEKVYLGIVDRLSSENPDVFPGKMMSSPGLKYMGKVFVFYRRPEMGFRLGPEFNPEESGLKTVRPLSPFKTKAPLKGWFLVGEEEHERWESLAGQALEVMSRKG